MESQSETVIEYYIYKMHEWNQEDTLKIISRSHNKKAKIYSNKRNQANDYFNQRCLELISIYFYKRYSKFQSFFLSLEDHSYRL